MGSLSVPSTCRNSWESEMTDLVFYQMTEKWLSTEAQTKRASGDQLCLSCHKMINKTAAHSIHTFAKCVGCHMPRIAKSAESGDIHSHVFVALLPEDTLKNPAIPNSCQACHKHKDEDVKKLDEEWKELNKLYSWRNRLQK